jgi:hypothetical protein
LEATDLNPVLVQLSATRRSTFGTHTSTTWFDLLTKHFETDAFAPLLIDSPSGLRRSSSIAGSALTVALRRIVIGIAAGTMICTLGLTLFFTSFGDPRLSLLLMVGGFGLVVTGILFWRDAQAAIRGVMLRPISVFELGERPSIATLGDVLRVRASS